MLSCSCESDVDHFIKKRLTYDLGDRSSLTIPEAGGMHLTITDEHYHRTMEIYGIAPEVDRYVAELEGGHRRKKRDEKERILPINKYASGIGVRPKIDEVVGRMNMIMAGGDP